MVLLTCFTALVERLASNTFIITTEVVFIGNASKALVRGAACFAMTAVTVATQTLTFTWIKLFTDAFGAGFI